MAGFFRLVFSLPKEAEGELFYKINWPPFSQESRKAEGKEVKTREYLLPNRNGKEWISGSEEPGDEAKRYIRDMSQNLSSLALVALTPFLL